MTDPVEADEAQRTRAAPWSGADIRAARLALGWTQADMAEVVGASPRTIGNWEGDHYVPLAVYWPRISEIVAAAREGE